MSDMKSLAHPQTMLLQLAALIGFQTMRQRICAVTFSATGDASPHNTQSFAKFFLGPIAENRAFVRCVRNFLKINIVGQDELGQAKIASDPHDQPETQASPVSLLKNTMKEKGVTFDKLKARLEAEKYEKVDKINTLEDIPKVKIFELIERLEEDKEIMNELNGGYITVNYLNQYFENEARMFIEHYDKEDYKDTVFVLGTNVFSSISSLENLIKIKIIIWQAEQLFVEENPTYPSFL